MAAKVKRPRRVGDVLLADEPGRRRRISRRLVIETALAAIDEDGLEALSMRTVAERLEVTPRALYRHVSAKDDLLLGVANAILADMRLPSPALPWRRRIRDVAFELRRVLAEHPHATPIFAGRRTSAPPAVVAIVDAVVRAFTDAGLEAETAVRTFFAIFNYTLGFALASASSETEDGSDSAAVFAGLDPEAVPCAVQVAPFLSRFAGKGLSASDEQFGFGLDLMLDSVSRRL